MSAAVQHLPKEIAEGDQSLTQLLRRTRVIAATLNLEHMQRWVDLELTGFAEDAELPTYRKVFTQRLEIHNSHRDVWQFAGQLNYALKARQPIEEIEAFSRRDWVDFPVAKNFSIKNDFGDPFGSDWPQRFVVPGTEYKRVIEAVAERWTAELEMRGISVVDAGKFAAFLEAIVPDESLGLERNLQS
jgi:AbiTii